MWLKSTISASVLLMGAWLPGCSHAQSRPSATPSQTANVAHAQDYDVTVSSVVATDTLLSGRPLRRVEYAYEFRGRRYVYIRGLGMMDAKGDLKYWTPDSAVEFREAPYGNPIVTVPLEETITFGGPLGVDIPAESDFSSVMREGRWMDHDSASSFHDTAVAVLGQYFPSGYVASQKNTVDYYMTQYHRLEGLRDGNLVGEVAVLVSHPIQEEKGGVTFHLQYAARESRVKSSSYRQASQDVIALAESLIQKLMNDLQGIYSP
jgi:hypothetical protein